MFMNITRFYENGMYLKNKNQWINDPYSSDYLVRVWLTFFFWSVTLAWWYDKVNDKLLQKYCGDFQYLETCKITQFLEVTASTLNSYCWCLRVFCAIGCNAFTRWGIQYQTVCVWYSTGENIKLYNKLKDQNIKNCRIAKISIKTGFVQNIFHSASW